MPRDLNAISPRLRESLSTARDKVGFTLLSDRGGSRRRGGAGVDMCIRFLGTRRPLILRLFLLSLCMDGSKAEGTPQAGERDLADEVVQGGKAGGNDG